MKTGSVRVCVRPSVRPGLKFFKFASSLSFLGQFWFCLFYLIGLVGAAKLQHRTLKFINYANLFKINGKCHLSILQRILIPFVLSDRAGWGLQNFYTEFWNSLMMQIYANLFKINEKCYFSILQRLLILFDLSDRGERGLWTKLHRILKFVNYANLCKFIQNQQKCYFFILQRILIPWILFVLSDRAGWRLPNFYTESSN